MKPRLLVTIPTEPDGSVVVHLAAWLLDLQRSVDDVDITCKFLQMKPVAAARNQQTREFLKGPWDYCLFVDDDAVPDTQTFRFLMDAIQKPEVDAVGGWSFSIAPDGPEPVVQKYLENGGSVIHKDILSRPAGLYEIPDGGLGAHCLMVKRKTMQAFFRRRIVWFKDVLRDHSLERFQLVELLDRYKDEPELLYAEIERYVHGNHDNYKMETCGERMVGQDVWFCRKCHDLGLRLWVDTRVCWGHVKPTDLRAEYMSVVSAKRELLEERRKIQAENATMFTEDPVMQGRDSEFENLLG